MEISAQTESPESPDNSIINASQPTSPTQDISQTPTSQTPTHQTYFGGRVPVLSIERIKNRPLSESSSYDSADSDSESDSESELDSDTPNESLNDASIPVHPENTLKRRILEPTCISRVIHSSDEPNRVWVHPTRQYKSPVTLEKFNVKFHSNKNAKGI
jgi:hypothetical protein